MVVSEGSTVGVASTVVLAASGAVSEGSAGEDSEGSAAEYSAEVLAMAMAIPMAMAMAMAIPMVMAIRMVMAIVGDPRRCDRRATSITGHHVAMMRRSATDSMHEGSPHRDQPHYKEIRERTGASSRAAYPLRSPGQ